MKARVILVLLSFWTMNTMAQSRSTAPHYGCESTGHEVSFEYSGQIKLNAKWLANPDDGAIKQAITQQLRYLRGYYISSRKNLPYALTLNAENAKIEILKIESGPYGIGLKIDPIQHPNVHIEHPYLLQAIAGKQTRPNDKGIAVAFKLQTSGYFCGSEDYMNSLTPLVPLDPYLAYWTVDAKSRRPIRWRNAEARINPCADPELADIPDPFYYWYFWDPNRQGEDTSKKKFDCKKMIQDGKSFVAVRPKLKPATASNHSPPPATLHPSLEGKKIEISAIFGVIDEHDLTFAINKKTNWDDIQREAAAFLNLPGNVDRGSKYYARFLLKIDSVMEVDRISTKGDLEIWGRLKQSNQKIHLNLFFGYTDVLGQNKPAHWNFLTQALQGSNYIIYNGHSGLGENLKIENALQATSKAAKDVFSKTPEYQMFAYFSCYSYGYFGEDFARERTASNQKAATDILLTGTEFTSERGPLGLLSYIDSIAARKPKSIDNKEWLQPSDQLILKTVTSQVDEKRPHEGT